MTDYLRTNGEEEPSYVSHLPKVSLGYKINLFLRQITLEVLNSSKKLSYEASLLSKGGQISLDLGFGFVVSGRKFGYTILKKKFGYTIFKTIQIYLLKLFF